MSLIGKIKRREAHIGVIGLGYVGLPLVVEFVKAGFAVTGFDVDREKVRLLGEGKSYIKHIDISPLRRQETESRIQNPEVRIQSDAVPGACSRSLKKGSRSLSVNPELRTPNCCFAATSDFSSLAHMDCIIVCVPTPLNRNREPDMTYVFETTRAIAANLRRGQLIVLESTTYPGTTDGDMRAILEGSRLKAGRDFFLAFSPEREDPNNGAFNLKTVPKVVGGFTPACLRHACALYDAVVDRTVPVSSTRVAEAAKLLENIYRSVNIALVNELKLLFDRMDIDVWEVIEAAKTKPFGFQPFYPGPGLGGHCIPIDPFYLTWKAREYDFSTRFIELAGEINTEMPYFVVRKIAGALNDHGQSLKGAKILILGVAYKPDVDDDRESPAFTIIDLLQKEGSTVDYSDPYFPRLRKKRRYQFSKTSVRLSPSVLAAYDAVVIVTNHSAVDYEMVREHGRLIIDTRNALGIDGLRKGAVYKA
jgi:UDP-N-acetyl-D-glucosamine dehydrogenase